MGEACVVCFVGEGVGSGGELEEEGDRFLCGEGTAQLQSGSSGGVDEP